jgi:hypothetical protein
MANRRVGFKEQSAYGTIDKVPDVYMGYNRFDAVPNPNKELEDTSAYRMPRYSYVQGFIGTITMANPLTPDNVGHLLKWATGSVASVVADNTVYKHTYTFAQELDVFTTEDCRGLTGVESNFLRDCAIRRFTIEAARGGKCSYEWEGQYGYEELDTLTAMGTLPALPILTFAGGAFSLGGSNLAGVEAFSYNIENAIPDDDHDVGSIFKQSLELEGLRIRIEADLKFNTTQNWDLRRALYGGNLAADSPQDQDATQALILYLVGSDTGEGVIQNYEMNITHPAVTVIENPSPVEGRGRGTQRVVLEALYNAGNQIELWNKVTSY